MSQEWRQPSFRFVENIQTLFGEPLFHDVHHRFPMRAVMQVQPVLRGKRRIEFVVGGGHVVIGFRPQKEPHVGFFARTTVSQ